MEELEVLKKDIRDFERALSRKEIDLANAQNEINQCNSKKSLLEKDIKSLEEKRDKVDLDVKNERKSLILEIESNHTKANKLKQESEIELSKSQVRFAEVARKDMELKALKEEYEARLSVLSEKEQKIGNRLKEIEEFKAKLTA